MFSKEVTAYTLTATNAKDNVTAVTDDLTAVIEIKYDGVVKPNGKDITWTSGTKNLVVKVTDTERAGSTTSYTVAVTKA